MKSDKFLSAIGNIDDDFIEEAAEFNVPQTKKPPKKLWLRYGSLAACLLIVLFGCVHFWPASEPAPSTGGDEPKTALNLPKLTIDTNRSSKEVRPKKAADESLLSDGSPWREDMDVKEMPVYKNTMYAAADGESAPVDEKELQDQAQVVAASLDTEVQDIHYDKGQEAGSDTEGTAAAEATAYKATAITDIGEISVTSDHSTVITFSQSVELPEEYRFPPAEMNREEAEVVTEYLLQEYGSLLSFENPQQSASAVYDETGNLKWIINGYDNAGDSKDEIINYSMKKMIFETDETGNLKSIILKDNLSSSEKIDSYPIITSAEAKKLLKKGNYITFDNDNPLPDTKQIENVNLVYLTGNTYETFLPYYSFDIRTQDTDSETSGLAQYATYYVPAVKGEYISNMPNAAE